MDIHDDKLGNRSQETGSRPPVKDPALYGRNGIFRIYTRCVARKLLRAFRTISRNGGNWRKGGYALVLVALLGFFSLLYFSWQDAATTYIADHNNLVFSVASIHIMYMAAVGVVLSEIWHNQVSTTSDDDILLYAVRVLAKSIAAALLINCLFAVGSFAYPQLAEFQTVGNDVRLGGISLLLGLFSDRVLDMLTVLHERVFGRHDTKNNDTQP